jgi:hypothetical protein
MYANALDAANARIAELEARAWPVAQGPMDRDEIAKRISFAHLGDDREWKGFRSHADRFLAYAPPSTDQLCAKCGCETKGEAALVDGEVWCHPCADLADTGPMPPANRVPPQEGA